MTTFAGPFDNGNLAQPQWEEVESKLWRNGVIAGARNQFLTTTTTGLGISVASGDAVLDGFRCYSDAATALTAAAADPSLDRIDLLVLRIDETAHTATFALKAGTPAASPSAPTPTQTPGGTYELSLYQVRVNAGATSISSLTDVRTYTAPAKHASAHASGGSDPIAPADIGAAALTGATFVGNVTLPTLLFGETVGGQHAQIFFVVANAAATIQAPQSGATPLGVNFQTWDGSMAKVPFAVGGAFGALSHVDNSGHFHDASGPVAVVGSHSTVPFTLSAGTSNPVTLDHYEIFFVLTGA